MLDATYEAYRMILVFFLAVLGLLWGSWPSLVEARGLSFPGACGILVS